MTAGPVAPGRAALGRAALGRAAPAYVVLGVLPPLLALVAEGAWVAVVYALLQIASGEAILIGPFGFAVAAGAGTFAGRVGSRRFGPRAARVRPGPDPRPGAEAGDGSGRARWPLIAVGAVALAAALGWALSPDVRTLLASGAAGAALSAHPGGWLAGLAFMRGVAHGTPDDAAGPSGSLLTIGVVAVCASYLVGGALHPPARNAFQDAALDDTLVFVASALVALALARIRQLGGSAGFDWRRNPAWLALLVTLVVGILLVAVPASFALGPVVLFVVAVLPVPLFLVGLFAGVDRRGWRLILAFGLLAALIVVAIRLFGGSGGVLEGAGSGQAATTSAPDQGWMTIAAWTFVLVLVAIVVALLAALWMRQAIARGDDDVVEERTIDYGGAAAARPASRRGGRRGRFGPPRTAPEAYLAVVRELADRGPTARRPGETPAEHAARVRAILPGRAFGGAVDLLAADYELATFAGRDLTATEHQRAIGRWRRVRSALARRPNTRPTT